MTEVGALSAAGGACSACGNTQRQQVGVAGWAWSLHASSWAQRAVHLDCGRSSYHSRADSSSRTFLNRARLPRAPALSSRLAVSKAVEEEK